MTERRMIRLSWPARPLWQNSRAHWRQVAEAKRAQRQEAWALCMAAPRVPCWPTAILEFDFYPPDNRRRDAQNLPATVKAAIDGIADAMGCDDTGFRCRFPDRLWDAVPKGSVLVTIKEMDAATVPLVGVIQ